MPRTLCALLLLAGCATPRPADAAFPRATIVPQPDDQLSFQVDGREWLRYHYGERTPKPYFYPVLGPSGAPVTRLTHPQDPFTHAHHLSLWIGHQSVNGLNFWEHMNSPARIVHDRVMKLEDGDRASLTIRAKWLDAAKKAVLNDERIWTFSPRYDTIGASGVGEYTLDLELKLSASAGPVTLAKSHFGLVAVRVAKMMGTKDGGGTIRNSEGRVNEAELMPHRKARWCDYSGTPAPGLVNGIALFDDPRNPNHPSYFHVRGDGWMGSSFTEAGDVVIAPGEPLVLRYRFLIHDGAGGAKRLDAEAAGLLK
jgi:hypothetical protein